MSDLANSPLATVRRAMDAGGDRPDPGETVDFDNDPPAEVALFIRLLRDYAARGESFRWAGHTADPELARKLTHLPPSVTALTSDRAAWGVWRSSYRPGQLYRRMGPGFMIIQDRRPYRSQPARIVIGDSRLQDVLVRCDEPLRYRAEGVQRAVQYLASADLVLVLGEWAVALPYRLAAWPVPAYSV